MKKLFIFLFSLLLSINSFSQKNTIPSSFCISKDEKKLFDFINTVRKDNGKKLLKLSKSLSYVAKTHVKDLLENHPDTSICNLSSWSNKGNWKPCCYNSYIPQPLCIKKKPKELTGYPYYGYEFAFYFEDKISVDSIIKIFSETDEVINMILTRDVWKEKKWVIGGTGINEHYVSVWFAQRPDNKKTPPICKEKKEVKESKKEANNKKQDNIVKKDTVKEYYVIHLSFKKMDNAKEALKRTQKNGFNNAGIIESDGKYRVYLNKFKTSKEALDFKNGLSKTFKESWIFTK